MLSVMFVRKELGDYMVFFFFQAEDGIRDADVTGVQTCALPISRVDHKTDFWRIINPWPDSPDGHPAGEGKYRFQWTAPLLISPHDPRVLYIGGNMLLKSVNEGQSWTPISPDLTRHDPATLGVSGGPITSDQTTAEYYATIFALAESPLRKGVLWAGSDDGLVHVTRDGGKTWADVTPRDVAPFTRVSIIEASHFAPGAAYLAKTRCAALCSTPAPSGGCGCRSTTGRTGSPCAPTSRLCRCTIWPSRRATSSRPRMDARSGFWMTSPRCGSWRARFRGKACISSSRATPTAWIGGAGSAAAGRRRTRWGRTRRAAR